MVPILPILWETESLCLCLSTAAAAMYWLQFFFLWLI
jgi:hypothetical protein